MKSKKRTAQKWVVFVGNGKDLRREYCNEEEEANRLASFHKDAGEQASYFFCDVFDDGTVQITNPPEVNS